VLKFVFRKEMERFIAQDAHDTSLAVTRYAANNLGWVNLSQRVEDYQRVDWMTWFKIKAHQVLSYWQAFWKVWNKFERRLGIQPPAPTEAQPVDVHKVDIEGAPSSTKISSRTSSFNLRRTPSLDWGRARLAELKQAREAREAARPRKSPVGSRSSSFGRSGGSRVGSRSGSFGRSGTADGSRSGTPGGSRPGSRRDTAEGPEAYASPPPSPPAPDGKTASSAGMAPKDEQLARRMTRKWRAKTPPKGDESKAGSKGESKDGESKTEPMKPPPLRKALTEFKKYERMTLDTMPKPIRKLIEDYEPSCYWFEVFECFRKAILVGLSVFFDGGSPEQLVFGLTMAFATFGTYAAFRPFKSNDADILANLCQVTIFSALVSAVVLTASKAEGTEPSPILIFLLMVALYMPMVVTVLQTFEMMPGVNDTWKARRARILESYSTIHTGDPEPAAIVPAADHSSDAKPAKPKARDDSDAAGGAASGVQPVMFMANRPNSSRPTVQRPPSRGSRPGTPMGSRPGTPGGSRPGTPGGSRAGTPQRRHSRPDLYAVEQGASRRSGASSLAQRGRSNSFPAKVRPALGKMDDKPVRRLSSGEQRSKSFGRVEVRPSRSRVQRASREIEQSTSNALGGVHIGPTCRQDSFSRRQAAARLRAQSNTPSAAAMRSVINAFD